MSPILGARGGLSASAYGFTSVVVVGPGDYESIQTVTVGSGGSSSVDFTSIPAGYSHLQVRGIARGTTADTAVLLRIQLNADTGNNYARHNITGDGSSVLVANDASQPVGGVGNIAAANATASIFGSVVLDILDYANTNKYKTIRSLAGNDRNGSGVVGLFSSLWMNTNAITSIKLFPAAANFAQHSSFALYGIK
jgi:hypothetical protein